MLVAGVDEAGRGPLAGPVVAAAVILPPGYRNQAIKDSKQLSKKARERLFPEIQAAAIDWAIVAVGHHRIEQLNILRASLLAMSLAVRRVRADRVLVDGNQRICTLLEQETVIGGDSKHAEIAAASILAKVWRDRLMETLDLKYPGYGLGKHAGYPTDQHRRAIAALGPSPIHRRHFAGVREFLHEATL